LDTLLPFLVSGLGLGAVYALSGMGLVACCIIGAVHCFALFITGWRVLLFLGISTAKLLGKDGPVDPSILKDRVFALYFSAHWCPPCRGFTPKLAEWYTKDLKAKGLEVVFVSSDRDEASFKEYFSGQPWLALDFSDRKMKELLSSAVKVDGIPTLAILDQELNLITSDGRAAVCADPTGTELPWHPKPIKDLAAGPGDINEVPTLLVFCEASDDAEAKAFGQALEPLAAAHAVASIVPTTTIG